MIADERFEVVLPNGDRATAVDEPGVVLAARTLIVDAERHGASSTLLRRGLYAYRDGRLDGELTRRCGL